MDSSDRLTILQLPLETLGHLREVYLQIREILRQLREILSQVDRLFQQEVSQLIMEMLKR